MTDLPASTAPAAAAHPIVRGRCPACGWASLFLGSGGHVTCARLDCPDPCLADKQLHGEQTAPICEPPHRTIAEEDECERQRLTTVPTASPCPACRRADQAGLAPGEMHDDCVPAEPAHDSGPDVAECAAADRAHWNDKYDRI
ncbi:hypothetical protein [Streptomyces sp. NPDC096324]|uniref:hypothetical protein n=1 Tax=Streptomyces sp. NPDC096324 TaxID=3366085 RepID=UPI00380B0C78